MLEHLEIFGSLGLAKENAPLNFLGLEKDVSVLQKNSC